MSIEKIEYQDLLKELIAIIEKTKKQVVSYANSSLTVMFWNVGNRILSHNLQYKRAEYGKQIVVTLSRELVAKFGKNYEEKNLRRMIQFAEKYPNIENVVTLSRHLSWSHFITLIPLKEQNIRDFYGKLAYGNLFGVRELREQIGKKVYERTENADTQLIDSNKIKKGIFKDPYLLDFLELKDGYLENDLEAAILKNLNCSFWNLEMGLHSWKDKNV